MSRALLTGGAGALGAALARRLLADPAYELRVSDPRPAPQWMREGCEIHTGDLRLPEQALAATKGCTHVIHLASFAAAGEPPGLPHTLLEFNSALHNAVIRAALDHEVERFAYVSSSNVFQRAELFPTTEEYLPQCPVALSAGGFSALVAERSCRAAHEEQGFPFTICRPFGAYGPVERPDAEAQIDPLLGELIRGALAGRRPLEIHGAGEQTRTPTHIEDLADGIIAAIGSPAALYEDLNLSASRELTVAELARIAWKACGEEPDTLTLKSRAADDAGVRRSWPSVEKAHRLLGWEARIEVEDGIASTVQALRQRAAASEPQPAASP